MESIEIRDDKVGSSLCKGGGPAWPAAARVCMWEGLGSGGARLFRGEF